MRIDLTVRADGGSTDLAISVPTGTEIARVHEDVAHVVGVPADAPWWCGHRRVTPTASIGSAGLRTGDVVDVGRPGPPVLSGAILALHQIGGPDAGRVVPLARGSLVLGRGGDCDIVLSDAEASRRHARIDVSASRLRVVDLASTNGTFLDDVPVPRSGAALAPGAVLRVGDCSFAVVGPAQAPAVTTVGDDGTVRVLRSPRLAAGPPEVEIEFPARPESTRPRGVQWVTAALPAAAGGLVAWLTDSPQFLLFALLSPVMMVSSSLGDRLHWRRSRRRAAATYSQRCSDAQAAIDRALDAETVSRRHADPDPAAVLRLCQLPGSRLWERRRGDADFLQLRVGSAACESRARRRTGSAHVAAGTVRSVPAIVRLRDGPVGIVGPRDVRSGVGRWLVGQLAALHSPADVDLTVCRTPNADTDWRWARWLPHLVNVAACEPEWSVTVAGLAALIDSRAAMRRTEHGGWSGPWRVLVLDDAAQLVHVPGMPALLSGGGAVGVTAICLADDEAGLPAACTSVVRVRGVTGTRADLTRAQAGSQRDIVLDDVSSEWADATARALAALVDPGVDGTGLIPQACRAVDLFGIDTSGCAPVDAGPAAGFAGRTDAAPEIDLDVGRIADLWAASDGGADTVLGVGPDGELPLDLVRDGPHALVAGTTGAGKSELLQTLVAGLATKHPPDLMNFLLVDYKGGAAFADCAQFPHTAGLVTDLDEHLTARALRSLDAELRRRERLFAAVGAHDLDAYRARHTQDPLARLIIVVDEFAALADELPDFVRGLVSVAQRGRSLGVHLVLATQRPGSVVSAEIRANTTTRIALRVVDPGESIDVIDTPDASAIERAMPGRGYLRTGSTLTCFQTARISGTRPSDAPTVEVLDEWRRSTGLSEAGHGPTDLARLGVALEAATRRTGRAPARSPWVDPLPPAVSRDALPMAATELASTTDTTLPYAITDLPAEQRRGLLQLDLAAGSSLLAAGVPRSGRTGLLASIAIGAASTLSPDELQLYAVDASGALASVLSALPHCATVLGPNDVALTPTLLRRLVVSVAQRAAAARMAAASKPSAAGPTSAGPTAVGPTAVGPTAAEQAVSASLPVSLLLIDGWDALAAVLGDADALESLDALAALHRREAGAALTIVVSGDRTVLAPRFASAFAERLLLLPSDRNDFGLVGLSARDAPTAMPPGRVVQATDGTVAQIAHAGDDPGLGAAHIVAAKVASRWLLPAARHRSPQRSSSGVRLRPLPESVRLSDLPPAPGRIVLGLGGEACEPVSIDLFAGAGRFLVAGPPRSGRSTVLCSMLSQLSAHDGVDVIVAAGVRSPLRTAARDCDGVRCVEPGADPAVVRSIPRTTCVLLVDDCEQFVDGAVAEALTEWVRSDVEQLVVVAAGRADELAISYRGVGAQIRRNNCGLLLRPGPVDGELLGARLARRPSSGPPGRGMLIGDPAWGAMFADGTPVPIQIAVA